MFNSKGNLSSSFLKLKFGLLVSGLAPNEGFSSFSLDSFLSSVLLVSGSTTVALSVALPVVT